MNNYKFKQLKNHITAALIFSLNVTIAQTIQTTLVPGTGNSIVQSSDEGYIITGWQGPYVILTKADSSGQVVWTKQYGDLFGMNPQNKGFDVINLTDGGFLLCGHYKPSTSINGAYFIRTNQNGDSLWTKYYQSPFMTTDEYFFYEIKQNSFGEFIAAGQIEYDSSQPFDIALMKLDSLGNQIWHKEIDLGKKETFKDLEITDTSYTIIGESYIVNSPVHDHFILRTDSSGNLNFSKLYSESECCDIISDLIINDDQNYVVAGFHNDSTGFYIDFFEFDYTGDTVIHSSIHNPLDVTISGFIRHTHGYILYGYQRNGTDDAFAIKVDADGNEIWRKLYGGVNNDEFYNGIETNNGMIAFTGYSNSFGSSTVYLTVVDTTGSIISNNYTLEMTNYINIQLSDFQLGIICDRNLYGPFEILIHDLLGKKIVFSNGYSADIPEWLSGIYIVTLRDNKNEKKFSSKLLITN